MAIKVALAAALLATLVAISTATSYTTSSIDEEGSQNWQQCSQQVQGRPFRPCQRFLRQSGSPFNGEEEEEEATENTQQQYLQECCQQLKQMDRQHCGCQAIRHAVRQAQQQGGSSYRTGQSEQIYQRARALPRRCNLSQQLCRFNVVFV